jgi:hypothetical protein
MSWDDDPSVILSGGPVRVTSDEDPDYVPPPFLGFGRLVWSNRDTGEVLAVAWLGEPQLSDPGADLSGFITPRLWQDEADQA